MCLVQWCCPLTVTRSLQSHLIPGGLDPITVTIELDLLMTLQLDSTLPPPETELLLTICKDDDDEGCDCFFDEESAVLDVGCSAKYTVDILVRMFVAVEDLIGFTGDGLRAVVPKTGKPDLLLRKLDNLLLLPPDAAANAGDSGEPMVNLVLAPTLTVI